MDLKTSEEKASCRSILSNIKKRPSELQSKEKWLDSVVLHVFSNLNHSVVLKRSHQHQHPTPPCGGLQISMTSCDTHHQTEVTSLRTQRSSDRVGRTPGKRPKLGIVCITILITHYYYYYYYLFFGREFFFFCDNWIWTNNYSCIRLFSITVTINSWLYS